MHQQSATPLLDMQTFRRSFAERYQDTIAAVDKAAEGNPSPEINNKKLEQVYYKINSLCRFAQAMIDMDYETGISEIFSEIHIKKTDSEVPSAYMFVGTILLLNLDKMEETNPEKARSIRNEVQLELDTPDKEASQYIIRNAINFIVMQRIDEGMDEQKRSDLQWSLSQPRRADSKRIQEARQQMRNQYFPKIGTHDDMVNNSIYLFTDDNDKASQDDIVKLPILSLFFHSYRCIAADKEGYLRQDDIEIEEFVPLSKALYALHDIDADFTARFVTGLLEHQSFTKGNIVNYVLADFLDQTSNRAFTNQLIDDKTYNERKRIARKALGRVKKEIKYDASMTNFFGLIYEREETRKGAFINEHQQYLTPFSGDSNAQIKAKETIASKLLQTPTPK